ncbi:unnamed protein product [Hydatigera taeniaeformis]|uniref:Protein kinase domain-containing protein n=1 Tax=Hydatigena taeniaeformis TaxID=6205 RepID=A0A158REB5_HYDTA|nr:unnamed protein product [Hydatigera taeniaeformis]
MGFDVPIMNKSSDVPSSDDTPDANVSDISMEVVNSELQSPIRRPPLFSFHPTPRSLQRIGEEDEDLEDELEDEVEKGNNDEETLSVVRMSPTISLSQILNDSCVQMSSQYSASGEGTSNYDSAAVTMRPNVVPAQSNYPQASTDRKEGREKDKASQSPLPPLESSSSAKKKGISEVSPNEPPAVLNVEETEVEADPISALVELSNVVVDSEKFIVLRQIARGGFSSVWILNKL